MMHGTLRKDRCMTMTNDNDKWKSCNDMIGRILTYLDEEDCVKRATKMAIKSEIWNFYNMEMTNDEQENRGNR